MSIGLFLEYLLLKMPHVLISFSMSTILVRRFDADVDTISIHE